MIGRVPLLAAAMLTMSGPAAAQGQCNADALEYAAQALDAERFIQARAMLDRMAGGCADHVEYREIAAELSLVGDNNAEALERYQALAAEVPTEPDYASGAGRAALKMGNLPLALQWLQAATALEHADWRAWNALAVLYDRQQRWEESAFAYDRALALSNLESAIWNNRGYSLIRQNRPVEALRYLEGALALDPDDERARANSVVANAMLGIYPERREAGETVKDWAIRLNNAGYGAMLAGENEAARSLFARALEERPEYFARAARNLDQLEESR